MNFDDFDKEMRKYEESLDQFVLSDMYIVTRLDGRSFTRLTKEICKFEAPFDVRFRDLMVETVKHLMTKSGFKIVYGYTESDEISLLFRSDENSFARKVRKINTTLSGEASAVFSLNLGKVATFDCRVIPLPSLDRVADYFIWRQEDSHRNSLNAHCYWALRKEGKTQNEANDALEGKSVPFKNELLFQKGINYNDLPHWQKRGVGVRFEEYEKEGFNPITQEKTKTTRRGLVVDYDIPLGEEYKKYVLDCLRLEEPDA